MSHSVLQRTAEPPSLEQLTRAFIAVPALTVNDARFVARHGFGIIADGLGLEDAELLRTALAEEGVDAAVVAAADLPALPQPKRLKRADCTANALVVYDLLGRPREIGWDRVTLLATGEVRAMEYQRPRKFQLRVDDTTGMEVDMDRPEHEVARLHLEILLEVEPFRYQARADEFLYHYLGARRRPGSAIANFCMVIGDLQSYAQRAVVNRGVAALAADQPMPVYIGRGAFEKEMVWLLWWTSQGAQ